MTLTSHHPFSKLNSFIMTTSTLSNMRTHRNNSLIRQRNDKKNRKKDFSKVSTFTKINSTFSQSNKNSINNNHQSGRRSQIQPKSIKKYDSTHKKQLIKKLYIPLTKHHQDKKKRKKLNKKGNSYHQDKTFQMRSPLTLKPKNCKSSMFSSTRYGNFEPAIQESTLFENSSVAVNNQLIVQNHEGYQQFLQRTENLLILYQKKCERLQKSKNQYKCKLIAANRKLQGLQTRS